MQKGQPETLLDVLQDEKAGKKTGYVQGVPEI